MALALFGAKPPSPSLSATIVQWPAVVLYWQEPPRDRTGLRKGAGRYPQPIALLARLGVDISNAGRGLGTGLLKDVIGRVAVLGTSIGCRDLVVHAESDQACDLYFHLIPGLKSSPTDPLHLVLLMKTSIMRCGVPPIGYRCR